MKALISPTICPVCYSSQLASEKRDFPVPHIFHGSWLLKMTAHPCTGTREMLKKAIPGHFQLGPSQARKEAH
jgi:hypothetical protein